jgi:hypothetical protein
MQMQHAGNRAEPLTIRVFSFCIMAASDIFFWIGGSTWLPCKWIKNEGATNIWLTCWGNSPSNNWKLIRTLAPLCRHAGSLLPCSVGKHTHIVLSATQHTTKSIKEWCLLHGLLEFPMQLCTFGILYIGCAQLPVPKWHYQSTILYIAWV